MILKLQNSTWWDSQGRHEFQERGAVTEAGTGVASLEPGYAMARLQERICFLSETQQVQLAP